MADDKIEEWHRLNILATHYEPAFRSGFARAAYNGTAPRDSLREATLRLVASVCRSTADKYRLVYDPSNRVYIDMVDGLFVGYEKMLNLDNAREAVRAILPSDLSLHDRNRRLLATHGLDAQTAVALEKERQEVGSENWAILRIEQKRRNAIQSRANLVAVTEVNRVLNASLVAIWSAQEGISKADVVYGDDIADPSKPGRRARKMILTRRDDRVCNYCDPLDGITARLSADFETEYGSFAHPPFHPRCRCFVYITTEV